MIFFVKNIEKNVKILYLFIYNFVVKKSIKQKKAIGMPIALWDQRASVWFHTTNVNNNYLATIYIDFIKDPKLPDV